MGKSSVQNVTHHPFIDFLNNDNKIFTGVRKSTTEIDDTFKEQSVDKNTLIPRNEQEMKLWETPEEKGETSKDDSPNNLSEEEGKVHGITFQRYLKRRGKL